MAKRENESNRLKDLIPRMLEENQLKRGMDQIQVRETWDSVMGPGIANYTQEVRLKDGVLIVRLSSSALRQELEFGKEKILRMMDESLTEVVIKGIRLT